MRDISIGTISTQQWARLWMDHYRDKRDVYNANLYAGISAMAAKDDRIGRGITGKDQYYA